MSAHTVEGLAALRPPGAISNIVAVGMRELRDALRSRWFLLHSLSFTALGLGISYVSSAGVGGEGFSGFGRTAAGLLNLVLLIVPLMALTSGAAAIASDRERGMLSYLLAQPIARWELLIGKYLGISAALITSIALGLGACAGILAWRSGAGGDGANPGTIAWLAALAVPLALAMLSIGMLVSVLARKASVATGVAVFIWLTLVFATDLGLMAGTIAFKLRIQTLFGLAMLNPLQVFKMWSLHAVDTSLDVLGPAGLYALDTFGSALPLMFAVSLAAWIVVPLGIAIFAFSRRSPT